MMSGMVRDEAGGGPDLTYGFKCRRSGRCCSVRGGVAWVSTGEQAAIADHLSMTTSEFQAEHTRELTHPRTGELRTALRDGIDGACGLLENGNQCSVYEVRPNQCRDFPFWKSVTDDAAGWERNLAICPGIEAIPSPTFNRRAAGEFTELMDQAARGADTSCPHSCGGKSVQVSRLEFESISAAFLGTKEAAGRREAGRQATQACPALDGQACSVPSAKPIACRDLSATNREALYAQLHDLHKRLGYPHTVGTIGSFAGAESDRGLEPISSPGVTP